MKTPDMKWISCLACLKVDGEISIWVGDHDEEFFGR